MASVREILDRIPPNVLYHYTNQRGLLGILDSREIWLSHTQYLNDAAEFRYAVKMVRKRIEQMIVSEPAGLRHDLLSEMLEAANARMESINVCVCSFSEDGDLLSQWRAYGGGSGGVSMGFPGAFLKAAAVNENFWLVPCVYNRDEQTVLVQGLIDDVLAQLLQRGDWDPTNDEHLIRGGNLTAYLNRYAPILKHNSFEEEREWRIISRPLAASYERFDYRPGISMLVPYFRLALAADKKAPLRINRVIVGPTPHPRNARFAVEGLLCRHNFDSTPVKNSATPFRNW